MPRRGGPIGGCSERLVGCPGRGGLGTFDVWPLTFCSATKERIKRKIAPNPYCGRDLSEGRIFRSRSAYPASFPLRP